jgi:hypothetical protein
MEQMWGLQLDSWLAALFGVEKALDLAQLKEPSSVRGMALSWGSLTVSSLAAPSGSMTSGLLLGLQTVFASEPRSASLMDSPWG